MTTQAVLDWLNLFKLKDSIRTTALCDMAETGAKSAKELILMDLKLFRKCLKIIEAAKYSLKSVIPL